MGILDPLYHAVTWVIKHIHSGLSLVLNPDSGAAWALSIILLTIGMRVLLFPLFVKQIQSTRKMQALQPQMKELQRKYKNDRERLNKEMMQLYQENQANPLGGCLPLLVQIPIFIALFQVLIRIAENQTSDWGLTRAVVDSATSGKLLGASIADRVLNSSLAPFSQTEQFLALGTSSTSARIVAIVMVLVSSTTMYLTMRHSMRRNPQPGADNPAASMQKVMPFLVPVFGLFTLWLPIGVLLYIVTTNVWTLGQNYYIYARYPAAGAGAVGGQSGSDGSAAGTESPSRPTPGSDGSGDGAPGQRRASASAPVDPATRQRAVRQQPVNRPKSKRSGSRKR